MHLTSYWLEFAVALAMDMVCMWGIRPLLAGCGRGSGFSIVTHFPSGWPKRGSVMGSHDEKYSRCYQEMVGNEKKPSPEIWSSENLNLSLVTKAYDIFHSSFLQMWILSSSFQWSIWHVFKTQGFRHPLVSHSACGSRGCLWLEIPWQGWVSLAVLTQGRSCKVGIAPAWLVWYKLFGLDIHNILKWSECQL